MEAERQIERKDTGIRILLTVFFMVILRVAELVLAAIVLFQLVFTLITKRTPGERVVRFANRIIAYVMQLLRYVTYQDEQWPFPFADFPADTGPANTSVKPNGPAVTALSESGRSAGPY